MGRKKIGIIAGKKKVGMNFSSALELTSVTGAMVDLVEKFCGVAVIFSPTMNPEAVNDVVSELDGLLLVSGEDVSPELYGASQKVVYGAGVSGGGHLYARPMSMCPDLQKDKLEIAFYKEAFRQGLPVLGICRGMQIMNVAEGGTLMQEVEANSLANRHFLDADGWIHYHPISVDINTKLGKTIGIESYVISSVHHQAIDRLAESFRVVSSSPDKVIEMIEHTTSKRNIWGIQGHPEKIYQNFPRYESVFKEFCL